MNPEKEPEPEEGAPPKGFKRPVSKINLPYSTDHFQVQWDSAWGKYLIVPNIPFDASSSPKDQLKKHWKKYVEYGKEALNWLKSQGVKPTKDNIIWWADEWWPKGAHIKIE